MTLDRTAARARCEAATPEPWVHFCAEYERGVDLPEDKNLRPNFLQIEPEPYEYEDLPLNWDNCQFIAYARTDLPAALDALDEKDAEIERLTRQVENFRDGLQGARDLYREKSGKPDRFSDEGDWWNEPDDQCVVLWLIEWAEDIQCELVKRLEAEIERMRRALLRIANGDFMGAGSLEIARAALEGRDSE